MIFQAMRFTPFPILTTERLSLRAMKPSDAKEVFQIRSHPKVNAYIQRTPPQHIKVAEAFVKNITTKIEKDEIVFWAICTKEQPEMIGSVCFWNLSEDGKYGEIGYELHPDFHGMGLMTEALQVAIQHGFSTFGFEQIAAYTHRENKASIQLLLKLGFVLNESLIDEDVADNQVFVKNIL